jgi:UMF1 family MFS transporter
MDAPIRLGVAPPTLAPGRLSRAAWSWALFQGARDAYFVLITIYVFAPYFVRDVVGDPIRGQLLVAEAAKWAGWAVLVFIPVLGAAIDRLGPRKPWLFGSVALMVPLTAALWWVAPGGAIGIPAALIILAVMGFLLAASDMLHNALLLPAAGMAKAGATSGLALALVNALSVASLAFVVWAFALPGKVAWGFIPAHPLFGLDPATHQTDRIVAPITAGLMLIGSIPLFAFVKDVPATGTRIGAAIRGGVADLIALAREARGHRNALLYLGSVLLFTDGLTGILVFTGVYAAGAMGWGSLDLLAYGMILSVFSVAGGFLAGFLDQRIGPKRALILELIGVVVSQIGGIGQTKTRLFFQDFDPAAHAPVWNGPLFRTQPDIALLCCGFLGAVSVTAAYASRRTMLTRVVPPDRIGVFFGLFAIAGSATMWLGPLLVEIMTRASQSQRIGILPNAGLALAGMLVLLAVKGGGRLDR